MKDASSIDIRSLPILKGWLISIIIWSRTQASIDQAMAKFAQNRSSKERLAGFRVDTGDESEVAGVSIPVDGGYLAHNI